MSQIKVNGIDLYVEEKGEGEPLLLVMGLGADGSLWEQHVTAYSRHFRCILMDNRGSGCSSKPEGPYLTRTMAEDALGVLNSLGVEKAHVSGISMGGAIAQELALLAPERVQTLTLVSTWHQCDTYTARIFETFKSLIQTSDPIAFNRLLQLWIFAPEYHNQHIDDLLQREEKGSSNPYPMPVHAFQAQCDACISHNTAGRLGQIDVPTLITVGNRDIFTPLSYSKAITGEMPNAELLVFEGCGHAHHWEQLNNFNEKTLRFLLGHSKYQ